MTSPDASKGGGFSPPDLSPQTLQRLVEEAGERYIATRRARIEPFAQQTFSFRASVELHRHAAGADIIRSPLNAVLSVPQVAVMGTAWGLRTFGPKTAKITRLTHRLERTTLTVPTDVSRELTFRLYRDFLELPWQDGPERSTGRDALAEEIMSDPRLLAPTDETVRLLAERGNEPAFRKRLQETLSTYSGTRAAAADIVTSLLCMGAGVAVIHHFTPGSWGLSAALAHKIALLGLPLGTALAGSGHTVAAAVLSGASLAVAGATVMGSVAVLGAFSGIISDPLQNRLGWHQRRLSRLLDVLESDLTGREGKPLLLKDHYVARVFDMVDVLMAIRRAAFPAGG